MISQIGAQPQGEKAHYRSDKTYSHSNNPSLKKSLALDKMRQIGGKNSIVAEVISFYILFTLIINSKQNEILDILNFKNS